MAYNPGSRGELIVVTGFEPRRPEIMEAASEIHKETGVNFHYEPSPHVVQLHLNESILAIVGVESPEYETERHGLLHRRNKTAVTAQEELDALKDRIDGFDLPDGERGLGIDVPFIPWEFKIRTSATIEDVIIGRREQRRAEEQPLATVTDLGDRRRSA